LKTLLNSILFLFCANIFFAQKDSIFLEDFYGSKVVYADIGFNTAPFSLRYNFPNDIEKITYKNNYKPFLGIGFAYKWFSVRASLPILGYFRRKELFGETKQYNLGFDFDIKKIHFDFEFKSIFGYSIQDANRWDPTLSESLPNSIVPKTASINLAMNAWYFNNKEFKIKGLHGKRAHYNKPVQTWYVKGTFNIFGTDNAGKSIIPIAMQDPSNSKTASTRFSAFDFGAIPGYAYVNRIKNWQFCGWFGLGGVIQSKFYRLDHQSRGFLGLAPRYDVRIMGGYSNKDFFVFLVTDFDNKSIRFSDLVYRQYYYMVKITGGIRLGNKGKRKS
jgi:hypothetical protein